MSEKRTDHRATPPTAAGRLAGPRRPTGGASSAATPSSARAALRATRRGPGKETGGGTRRAPSAAKRGGKPWAMAPAELSAAIDALAGGNHSRFARVCGVHDRTVRSWLAGKPAIPKAIQVLVAALRRLDDAAREEIVREAGAIE